ncbi:hypothetical protein [Vibrio cholerae]|uniref:hypothetical protein n=1 Tax=Vibrio cholerae TaxID=666 RepID=UPI00215F39BD|nr:hypothetical protein [Vibrio cholerae]MCS0096622.1 hypothetical protein [Vibrio cholerae]
MKNYFVLIPMLLFASTSSAESVVVPTKKDLMEHYIENLEHNYIGQSVNLYDESSVHKAMKQHQEYLMLCSHTIASQKCELAAEHLLVLDKAMTSHVELKEDLTSMWAVKKSLAPTHHVELQGQASSKGYELLSSYITKQACILPNGDMDLDCLTMEDATSELYENLLNAIRRLTLRRSLFLDTQDEERAIEILKNEIVADAISKEIQQRNSVIRKDQ